MNQFSRVNKPKPSKRAINVSLQANLVADAKEMGVNISRACETGLASAVKEERERRWKEENKAAIDDFNDYVDTHGIPLAKYRQF